jgi:hypothetical protein
MKSELASNEISGWQGKNDYQTWLAMKYQAGKERN